MLPWARHGRHASSLRPRVVRRARRQHGGLLALAAIPVCVQKPDLTLERLNELLMLPTSGHYAAETSRHLHPISEADERACSSYVRRLRAECWQATSKQEADWIELQQLLNDERPIALPDRATSREERESWNTVIDFCGSSFRVRQQGVNAQGDYADTVVHASADETVGITTIAGRAPSIVRAPRGNPLDGARSWLLDATRWIHQTRVLADLAREQGAITAGPDELLLDVSVRAVSVRDRFEKWFWPSNGVLDIPGMVHVRLDRSLKDSHRLTVEWADCAGGRIWTTQMLWMGTPPRLRSMAETRWIPGTGSASWECLTTLEVTEQECEEVELSWQPSPGTRVSDRRFGSFVSYVVGENGEIPSDAEIAARSDHDDAKGNRVPTTLPLDAARERETAPERSAFPGRTLVWGGAVLATAVVGLFLRLRKR